MPRIDLKKDGKGVGRFDIKNLSDQRAELIIYGEIASDSWETTAYEDKTPNDVKILLESAGKRDLDIYINSPGGNMFAGIAIYNMLLNYEGKKRVYIEGIAASISSVIAMAGDEIYIPTNAYFMIHKAWGTITGNADKLREKAENFDRLDETMVSIYNKKTQKNVDVMELMKQETWISGADALKYFHVIVSDKSDAVAYLDGEYINKETTPIGLTESESNFKNSGIELIKAKLELKLKLNKKEKKHD